MNSLFEYHQNFLWFDEKLKLGLAIQDIRLNEEFVKRKYGNLKECHLMLYKLIDIFFSYEIFFKLYDLTYYKNLSGRHILWLDYETNKEFKK